MRGKENIKRKKNADECKSKFEEERYEEGEEWESKKQRKGYRGTRRKNGRS